MEALPHLKADIFNVKTEHHFVYVDS